jgi:hypothetical protein
MKSANDNKKVICFEVACAEASQVPEFVKQYNRLTNSNFNIKCVNDIENQMDELKKFAEFYYKYVWSLLPDDCFVKEEGE